MGEAVAAWQGGCFAALDDGMRCMFRTGAVCLPGDMCGEATAAVAFAGAAASGGACCSTVLLPPPVCWLLGSSSSVSRCTSRPSPSLTALGCCCDIKALMSEPSASAVMADSSPCASLLLLPVATLIRRPRAQEEEEEEEEEEAEEEGEEEAGEG